jgi:amino acid transporter
VSALPQAGASDSTLPRPLFFGAAIASVGGPLALVALYLPGAAGDAIGSSFFTALIAALAFLAPLAIWLGYSERIVSAGGLAAFVEAAAGLTVARIQAVVWTVSYFLYIPYTVTYVVYDVLPAILPGLTPYRSSLELAIPAAIVVLVLAPRLLAFQALTLAAVAQLGFAVVLGVLAIDHAGTSFAAPAAAGSTVTGAAAVSLLFVCSSLPLFFAHEVRGGARSVRNGLLLAYGAAAAVLVLVAIPLSAVPASLRRADLPGVAMAEAYGSHWLGVAIGVASAASVTGLIVLEYLALGRLLHWAFRLPVRTALAGIAVPFVAADAISLIDPDRFYDDLLRPSLIALWLSQLIVFGVFPLFRWRFRRRLLAPAVALAAIAAALAGYGLYTAIANNLAT